MGDRQTDRVLVMKRMKMAEKEESHAPENEGQKVGSKGGLLSGLHSAQFLMSGLRSGPVLKEVC